MAGRESVPRLRYGMLISLEEYSAGNIDMVRNFQAEAMAGGYIGFYDTLSGKGRVFVYDEAHQADEAVRIAKSIGFSSAGRVEGEIFVKNSSLRRPHLKNIRRKDHFYREYYR